MATKKPQTGGNPMAKGKVKTAKKAPAAEQGGEHKSIHPKYEDTTITCLCGSVIHTRSTKQNIRVEICSSCHPFFTGKQKFLDTAGRIEKFQKRYQKKA